MLIITVNASNRIIGNLGLSVVDVSRCEEWF